MCEIQSTEVFLSGFNALYTFSHLLNEIELKKRQGKMKNDDKVDNIIQKQKQIW
jgi:hypothetical protein